jgi:signal peptidase I
MKEELKVRNYPGILPEDDTDIEVLYPEQAPEEGSLWAEARSLGRDIIFAAVTAVLIVVFVVQPVKVEGTSMQPRLENDERIFVNKLSFFIRDMLNSNYEPINRDDIVVFWFPNNPSQSFIKRVIGLPGETIRIDFKGQLFVNGHPADEPFLAPERTRFPQALPDTYVKPHYYFVMGDNRDASNDSRSWGLVPEKYIYGKALFRYWPLPRAGLLND